MRPLACGLLLVAAALTGCADDEPPRLQGDRIPIRPPVAAPVRAATAEMRPIPPAVPRETWTQTGGDAGHSGGHLAAPATLALAWRADAGAAVSDRVRTSRPVIAGGKAFVRDGAAGVRAFDAASGRLAWSAELAPAGESADEGYGGGLAWEAGRLFVTTGYGEVLALSPDTGEVLWRTRIGAPFRAPPAVLDGVVTGVTRGLEAVGLDAATGAVLWRSESAMTRPGNLAGAAPAMAPGVTAAPFGSGEIQLLRSGRGVRLWSVSLTSPGSAEGLGAFTDITSDPVIAAGPTLVAGNAGGALGAFDGRTGRRLWQRDFGALSPVWAAGDTVFVATTEPALHRLDLATGATLWSVPLDAWLDPADREGRIAYAGPVLAGGRLLLTSTDGRLLSHDPQTGAELSSIDMPAGSGTGPAVAGGAVYVLTDAGELLAWR